MIVFILFIAFLLLSWGLACAVDDGIEILGWDETEPYLRPLLPGLYLIVAGYGVLLLSKKVVSKASPHWWLYVRVMWFGGKQRATTPGIELVMHLHQSCRRKPSRKPQWQRNLVACIMRQNKANWPKLKTTGTPDEYFSS